MFNRLLKIELPERQSAFLWGARKTGKSTWLRQKYPANLWFDLLQTDVFFKFIKEPHRFREEILAAPPNLLAQPIIVDEVQKVPALLDEIHGLIETRGLRFVLCGSSARKLRRGHANLLGGRAWRYELGPLVSAEIGTMNLLRVVNAGLLPSHYTSPDPRRSLQAYIQDYVREEIIAEGMIRNLPAFTRFLDAMALGHGGLVNFANVARDCGVDAKTVRTYYDILVDTLLGDFLPPFVPRRGRESITAAEKFYMIDVGVVSHLTGRVLNAEQGADFGQAFEHFIWMELRGYRRYSGHEFELSYWRTKSGLEVDFVLAKGEVAIEVKGGRRVDLESLRGLRAFGEEAKCRKRVVVSNEGVPRKTEEGIEILPWREFLTRLWAGEII